MRRQNASLNILLRRNSDAITASQGGSSQKTCDAEMRRYNYFYLILLLNIATQLIASQYLIKILFYDAFVVFNKNNS